MGYDMNEHILEWTSEDVADYVDSLGLPQYHKAFTGMFNYYYYRTGPLCSHRDEYVLKLIICR